MPLQYNSILLSDFSGGITDRVISAPPNTAASLDNFLINEYGKAELRWGTELKFEQDAIQRIMGLYKLNDDLLVFRNEEMYLFNPVGPALDVLVTPNAEPFFQTSGSAIYPNAAEWRDQLYVCNTDSNRPMRIHRDETNTLRASEIGLPEFTGATFTPTSPGATYAYLYELYWSYTYNVGGTTYTNYGQTYLETVETSVVVGTSTINISGIPTVSVINGQLDVANFKAQIYRTRNGESNRFFVAEVPHGTSTYADSTDDATLLTRASGYTNGGELEHVRAPKCKAMIITNDIAYYISTIDETTGEPKPYRVQQSFPGIPSATDPSFFIEVDDVLVGGSHVGGIPIIFTESFIYRVEGSIDAFGNGVMRKRIISETVGCVSHSGIVRVNDRIFWMGKNGVYVTDGFKISPIPSTLNLQDTYAALTLTEDRRKKVNSVYDYREERIYWNCSDNDVENNQMLVLNLKTGGFSKVKGDQFFPTTAVYNGEDDIVRGDELGYLYSHNSEVQSDLKRNVLEPASTWTTLHIPYYFESILVDFGNPIIRKWVPMSTMSFGVVSNLAIRPISSNDKGRVVEFMKEIRSVDSFFWNDPNFIWNDANTKWRAAEIKTYQRHFPRGSMRCRRKQVALEPAKVIRFISDSLGEATLAIVNPGVSPTISVTLDTAGVSWPADVVDQFITFESEDHANLHGINSRTDTQLIVTGGGSPTIAAGQKWHIVGFEKDQKFTVESIGMTYANIDNQGDKYSSEKSGANE